MSRTRNIIETENLISSEINTVLSELKRRSETPKKRNTQSIWDLDDDTYLKQEILEPEIEAYSNPFDIGNVSSVPNMYDVKEDEVGIWLDSTVLDYSEECYADENDLFDVSTEFVKPDIKMHNRDFICSMQNSSNNSHMDVTNGKESFSAVKSKLVSENEMDVMESEETTKIGNDLENYLAKDLVFSSVNECKRDLTTPEKITCTKRQCVDTNISSTTDTCRPVRCNLDIKLVSVSAKKNSLENVSDENRIVDSKSLNENSVELHPSENGEKSNCRLKEFKTLPFSSAKNEVIAIEKKCSEWKSMQEKLNSHCEWRKRTPEKLFNFKREEPVVEFMPSKSNWLKNHENTNLSKSSELTDVLHSEVKVNKPDHLIVYDPDKSVANKLHHLMSNKPYKSVVNKPDEPVGKKPDEPVVKKPDKSVVNKPDKPVVNKPDKPVVDKPDKPVVNKPDKTVVNKPDISVVNRVGNASIRKSNDISKQNTELAESKKPIFENLSKADDMVNLLVIGRNRNSELVVQRQVLERLRSRYSQIIPSIDSEEIVVNYSLDAITTFLRFLFSAPYNLSSWKVALEVISMTKVYNLLDLRNTCLQYLENNFPPDELELVVEYICHYDVLEDCKNLEVLRKMDTSSSLDNADKPRIFTATCSISAELVVDSCEFCIPLDAVQEFMGCRFEADIKNDLAFEALQGTFCITGIQIKLTSGFSGNSKKNVVYSVTKRNKTVISDTKEKPFKSLIIINFNKKVIVKQKEIVKISIMIEDIQARLCCTTPKVKLTEKTDAANFKISLSSNKNHEKFRKPLFFIEKLFYTLNA